jgi:hypothetical protein
MDEQSLSDRSSTSSPTEISLSNDPTKFPAGVQPEIVTDWRDTWARGNSGLSSDPIGELLDLDMRLSALPPGTLRDKLGRWLDDVGGNLVSGSLQPPNRGNDNTPTPLHPDLRT